MQDYYSKKKQEENSALALANQFNDVTRTFFLKKPDYSEVEIPDLSEDSNPDLDSFVTNVSKFMDCVS